MAHHPQSSGAQFQPGISAPQGQMFIPSSAQQYQLVPQSMSSSNVGIPTGQQFSQPLQQLPPRASYSGYPAPSSQAMPMPYVQTSPLTSVPSQSQPNSHPMVNYISGMGAPGLPVSSSYTYGPLPTHLGQPQNNVSFPQFQPMSQVHAPVGAVPGQSWLSSGGQSTTLVASTEQSQQSSVTPADSAVNFPSLSQQFSSDWQEHTSTDGRRYYYNKRTKQSSWEKPLELMTPLERADASTVWKEFTTQDGKKYYYNKVTRESKWAMPDELKLAREHAQKEASQRKQPDMTETSHANTVVGDSLAETAIAAVSVNSSTATVSGVALSSLSDTPVVTVSNLPPAISPVVLSTQTATTTQPHIVTMIPQPVAASGSTGVPNVSASITPVESIVSQEVSNSADGSSMLETEEARKVLEVSGKVSLALPEERAADDEPLVFASKLEAKNAFKALLESANVKSDWTWEQTMREIVNDKRYGALKTLGERKQAFNEYLGQRKKLDAEERRMRQKKAREEFTKMLEESKELTSSTRWSKAVGVFENDERFKAVERVKDREDLYESYIVELERKEKERAAEEHKKNIAEYRKFLESCDFVKVNSQWRKVQDRLEDDERCLRLEKLDRLLIFQDYIRDLEKEEDEQKKMQKEQMRRVERKNRDEFRRLMEEDISDGLLTAKTLWRDYCLKVKDLPQYQAVASNMSGSTPKDLFEDVAEELEKQYHDDKAHVKDEIKSGKITIASTWTFEEFKAAIGENAGSLSISDINFKLVYEDLIERAKEKEEKEAKRRQRLADDFSKLLHTFKEITASSTWEDSKQLFEDSQEYRSIEEESFKKEVFLEYVTHLQEKAKEKERRREEMAKKEKEREEKEKRKEKEKKEKEKEREREKEKGRSRNVETDDENMDINENHGHKEDKRREKEKDKKHRKRHQSATDDNDSDKEEKEESKSRKHGSDRKRSRKAYTPESDSEGRDRRHRRHHRDSSRRNGRYEELEDGELGEDGEIQ